MNISSKLKIMAIATLLVAACGQANARRPHRHHIYHPTRVVVVPAPVHHPVVTHRVSNRFSQKERLAMVLAYLNNNPRLTVKQYAKITSLNKEAAEANLMPSLWIEISLSRQSLMGKRNSMSYRAQFHDRRFGNNQGYTA